MPSMIGCFPIRSSDGFQWGQPEGSPPGFKVLHTFYKLDLLRICCRSPMRELHKRIKHVVPDVDFSGQ